MRMTMSRRNLIGHRSRHFHTATASLNKLEREHICLFSIDRIAVLGIYENPLKATTDSAYSHNLRDALNKAYHLLSVHATSVPPPLRSSKGSGYESTLPHSMRPEMSAILSFTNIGRVSALSTRNGRRKLHRHELAKEL